MRPRYSRETIECFAGMNLIDIRFEFPMEATVLYVYDTGGTVHETRMPPSQSRHTRLCTHPPDN